jgi:VanZ family protein
MVPAAMVFAALGLMLSFVPRNTAVTAVALAVFLALIASQVPIRAAFNDAAIMACWVAIAMLAIRTYWPGRAARLSTLAISAATGIASGIAIAASVAPSALWQPMLASLVVIPATVAVERGYAVAPRVVVSWLVAVAVLAALLPYVVTHPGYVADHRG